MDTTEKLGLNLPEKGYEDWGVPLNENFEKLDTAVGNLEEVIDTKVAALETRVNEEIGVAVEGLQGEVSNLSEQTAKLAGNNTFTGINAFTSKITSAAGTAFTQNIPDYKLGEVPISNYYPNALVLNDKEGQYFGFYGPGIYTDGSYAIRMGVKNQEGSDYNIINVGFHADGTPYSSLSYSPLASDNSKQIATTEWVLANAGIKISYEDE